MASVLLGLHGFSAFLVLFFFIGYHREYFPDLREGTLKEDRLAQPPPEQEGFLLKKVQSVGGATFNNLNTNVPLRDHSR